MQPLKRRRRAARSSPRQGPSWEGDVFREKKGKWAGTLMRGREVSSSDKRGRGLRLRRTDAFLHVKEVAFRQKKV